MRPITFPVLLVVLSGCAGLAVPPGLTIASYAVDGASYLGSGKSMTDHMLSDWTGRDCATWRIIKSRPICHDFTPEEIATRKRNKEEIRHDIGHAYIATNLDGLDLNNGTLAVAGSKPRAASRAQPRSRRPAIARHEAPKSTASRKPVVLQPALATVARKDLPAKSPRARKMQPTVAGDRYLVFGSFRRRGEAVRFAGRHAVMKPSVLPVKVRGKRYYRVVVRPGGRQALTAARHALRRKGVRGAYTMRICRPGTDASHCMRAARPSVGGG